MSPWAHCWRHRENVPTFQFAEAKRNGTFPVIGAREAKKTQLEEEATQMTRVVVGSSAASRVLRKTYLKHSLGHVLFEDPILLQHLNDTDVGTFPDDDGYRSFRILRSDARESEGGNRDSAMCVGFGGQSDRGAPYRAHNSRADAGPEARASDIFQSFVVGATLVKQHDGQALAADIRDSDVMISNIKGTNPA